MTNPRWRSSAELDTLERRAAMLRSLRAFFDERGVLELETPLIASQAVTDVHLDSMRVDPGDGVTRYLNTSPEYCMKRFIAQHQRDVYQLCKAFRGAEAGPLHNPEFSMLEWYRIGFDLDELMSEVAALVRRLAGELGAAELAVQHHRYAELFAASTGIDPHDCSIEQLAAFAIEQGIEIPAGLSTTTAEAAHAGLELDAWLDWLMSVHVTRGFERGSMNFIRDYPVTQAALARIGRRQGVDVASRFELYIEGIEIANGYHELADADEQRQRFDRDNARRSAVGKATQQPDALLLAALAHGLPDCCGVALGIDRLLAVLTGKTAISDTISYTWTNV